MNKKFTYLVFLFLLILLVRCNLKSPENLERTDWMTYMNESCGTTLTGNIKSIFYGDLDLWSDVEVTMDLWAEDMKLYQPEDNCEFISSREKWQQECRSKYQARWDWYHRCIGIANKNFEDAKAEYLKIR
jgi:hypothetical protein